MKIQDCTLCPRMCHANRSEGQKGFCRMGDVIYGARAALHMWEEPCISGEKGSGTIFFSGCSLNCVYCQNYEISQQEKGKESELEVVLNYKITIYNDSPDEVWAKVYEVIDFNTSTMELEKITVMSYNNFITK